MLVISITGVMLVWKREYLWVSIPAARALPSEQSILADAAAKIQASYPPDEVLFVRFYAEGLSVHKVFLSDRRYAWHDQYGEQLQVWSNNERLEDWLLDLHHRLLLGNTVGLNAVGFTGLLLLPLMLMGLAIWWPWRKSYKANLVPQSGQIGHLRKSHYETGVSVILPALLIAITGVILVYPTQARILLRDGFSDPTPPVTITLGKTELGSQADFAEAFTAAKKRFPDGKLHWLSYPKSESPSFTIGVQEADSWNRMGNSSIKFNEQGSLTLKYQAQQSVNNQALDYAYPIHAGKFPTWYRLLLSGAGILIAWLCFLGLLAFFKGRR